MAYPGSRVHVAFRFQRNSYHSYRGDPPDELAFDLEIRVTRNTIDYPDSWNSDGAAVKVLWDIVKFDFAIGKWFLMKVLPYENTINKR